MGTSSWQCVVLLAVLRSDGGIVLKNVCCDLAVSGLRTSGPGRSDSPPLRALGPRARVQGPWFIVLVILEAQAPPPYPSYCIMKSRDFDGHTDSDS